MGTGQARISIFELVWFQGWGGVSLIRSVSLVRSPGAATSRANLAGWPHSSNVPAGQRPPLRGERSRSPHQSSRGWNRRLAPAQDRPYGTGIASRPLGIANAGCRFAPSNCGHWVIARNPTNPSRQRLHRQRRHWVMETSTKLRLRFTSAGLDLNLQRRHPRAGMGGRTDYSR